NEIASVDHQASSRLEDDLEAELGAKSIDCADERANVIAFFVDEVSAAEINGPDALELRRKIARDVVDQPNRAVVQGLTQGMDVEDVEVVPGDRPQRLLGRAEAGIGCTWIIEDPAKGGVGIARVDANANGGSVAPGRGREADELFRGIEIDVVGK